MKKQTAKALWQSIEHWHANWADPRNADIYSESCPLCHRFYNDGECVADSGEKCPVFSSTGYSDCKFSPWIEVRDAIVGISLGQYVKKPRLKEAMRREIEFLVDLVP